SCPLNGFQPTPALRLARRDATTARPPASWARGQKWVESGWMVGPCEADHREISDLRYSMAGMTTAALEDTIHAPLAEIGTLIRATRQAKGVTQAQPADLLGTSQSAIARIEAGGQNLSVEMLTRINAALNADLVTIGTKGP